MWCNNCHDEYREGITECPVCHAKLTDIPLVEIDPTDAVDRADAYEHTQSSANMKVLASGNHVYVEKSTRYEDMKSTAYSFLLVGSLGFLLLILFWSGVLPLQFADYMKYMMTVVMGLLFLIFLVIGLRSYKQLAQLKAAVLKEQQQRDAAKDWFFTAYQAKSVDAGAAIQPQDTLEQKYFLRRSYIKRVLSERFPDYEDDFCEYLLEQFYEELYPQD